MPLGYRGCIAGEGVRLYFSTEWTRASYNSRKTSVRLFQPGIGAACAVLSALVFSGCSISMPISSLVSPASDGDVTGSISRPPFADWLSSEDWRRARAAMATALDPQGNGSTVAWDNPDTGIKGKFIPNGQAYPENDRVCRSFVAEIDLKSGEKSIEGKACADKTGDWTVADIKSSKKT